MVVHYWIGDFFVDLSRNQITKNEHSQILTPKALAVLTYLAENQGQVVSVDAILSRVWLDTAVSPNTLQRSIALLRKALGDNSKSPTYIKTHAKQGYSLESEVRWINKSHSAVNGKPSLPWVTVKEDFKQTTSDNRTIENKAYDVGIVNRNISKRTLSLISIVISVFVLGAIGFKYLGPKQPSALVFDKSRSLTASDEKEFNATYSPDGKYIIFHRYSAGCINNIWAKGLTNQQEIQLTRDWAAYGSHSLSNDGKTLVFLATEDCRQPVTQKRCHNLMRLDFEKALESPQYPDLMMQCKDSELDKPLWLNNDSIGLLQKKSTRWTLTKYSISQNKSIELFDIKDGNIIDFTYSAAEDLIAVISIHRDGLHYIEMLNPSGDILSSHLIKRPKEISKFRFIHPSFDPLNKQLVFSTGKQLFSLSYEGKITQISLPINEPIWDPNFHPEGKKLLLIKGSQDTDVGLIKLDQSTQPIKLTQEQPIQTYTSLERSNLAENSATFQPGGDLIAFMSDRSGEAQLWITDGINDGINPRQLTHFPADTYINGIDWSEDGKSILVNSNGTLTQVFLDSSVKSFPFEYPVIQLFQWNSDNNTALIMTRINGLLKFVAFELNNSQINEMSDKKIQWALKSDVGELVFKDNLGRFWRPGPAEAQPIQQLDNQSGSKRFIINNNRIFGINSEKYLWSYDLKTNAFEILRRLPEQVAYLSDINMTHLLVTLNISSKKEVVELSLSE